MTYIYSYLLMNMVNLVYNKIWYIISFPFDFTPFFRVNKRYLNNSEYYITVKYIFFKLLDSDANLQNSFSNTQFFTVKCITLYE